MRQKQTPQLTEGGAVELRLSQQFLANGTLGPMYGTKWVDGKVYGFDKHNGTIYVDVSGTIHTADPDNVLLPLTKKELLRYTRRE